jgi:putative transposase
MQMIDSNFTDLSINRQLELLVLSKSRYYYKSTSDPDKDQDIANQIHELWLKYPFYGYRKITAVLRREGFIINHKKVQRLMKQMNLGAIFPKAKGNYKKISYNQLYPYLLKDLSIDKSNQVWTTDITYIRMNEGFVYLVAIVDRYSRFILSAYLSTSLEAEFCVNSLNIALGKYQKPEIFNTDQGSQFTSTIWTNLLEENQIKISMDGKGRCFDNIHQERLWRTVKYEEVYLKSYDSVSHAREELTKFIEFYNYSRPHQSLNYKTPAEIYFANVAKPN